MVPQPRPCPLTDALVTSLPKHDWTDIRIFIIIYFYWSSILVVPFMVPFHHWYEKTEHSPKVFFFFCFGIMRNNLSRWSPPAALWQKRIHISVTARINSIFVTALLWKASVGSRCSKKNIVPAKYLWASEQSLIGKQSSIMSWDSSQDFLCLSCTLCQARGEVQCQMTPWRQAIFLGRIPLFPPFLTFPGVLPVVTAVTTGRVLSAALQ